MSCVSRELVMDQVRQHQRELRKEGRCSYCGRNVAAEGDCDTCVKIYERAAKEWDGVFGNKRP